MDITHDPAHGVDAPALGEMLRLSEDPRIKYVVSNARIFSSTRLVKSRQRAPDSALLCYRISSRLENPPWSKCDCLKFRPHANCGY
jgi:hypothetical protein